MMTELQAKSLTIEELAQRLRDHDDIGVRVFAEKVLGRLDVLDSEEPELF